MPHSLDILLDRCQFLGLLVEVRLGELELLDEPSIVAFEQRQTVGIVLAIGIGLTLNGGSPRPPPPSEWAATQTPAFKMRATGKMTTIRVIGIGSFVATVRFLLKVKQADFPRTLTPNCHRSY